LRFFAIALKADVTHFEADHGRWSRHSKLFVAVS